jgi:ABC-type lipoprotein release transport system permease subunit
VFAASRLIERLLYGVNPHDAATLVATTGMLATVAFVACVIPALRAAGVDPATALRAE